MKKNTVLQTLASFEDDVNIEILIERLLFVEKIEKGLQDFEEGRVLAYNDVKHTFLNKKF